MKLIITGNIIKLRKQKPHNYNVHIAWCIYHKDDNETVYCPFDSEVDRTCFWT